MEIFDFNKISYPKETAYFIGFVWADGAINRNNYVVIEINKDDALNLFNIFSKVCDFKYSERQRVKRKPQSTFFFNNKEMAQFFIENGKYSNTIESHKKILEYIPDDYKIYFLRGLIDGDGCFYAQKPNKKWHNNAPQFTIAGRYEQDWDALCEYLKSLGVNMTIKRRVHKTSKSSIIQTTSPKEIEILIDKLYLNEDNIFLERKFKKSKDIIEEHKRCTKESLEKRQKYEIFDGNTVVVVDSLRKYAIENNCCYELLNKLANNRISKYKNYTIKKI